MRPSKQTIDTQSKSGISPARSARSLSTAPFYQKQLDDYTRQMEVERRKFIEEEKAYSIALKELEAEKMLLKKLKTDCQNSNIKSIPFKTRVLSSTVKNFSSNDNLKFNLIKLRQEITVQRKEKNKHKQMCQSLNKNITEMQQKLLNVNDRIEQLKFTNQQVKQQILKLKTRSKEDGTIFNQEIMTLGMTYSNEKKQYNQKKDSRLINLQTGALPILKRRLGRIIQYNNQKIGIIGKYIKTSQEINRMFEVISSHSGKDSITQIVEEFVNKQKIIFRLEEQVSHLQNQLIEKRVIKNQNQQKVLDHSFLKKQQQASSLKSQIAHMDNIIKESHQEKRTITTMFQKVLQELRNSKITIPFPKFVQNEESSTNQNLYDIMGQLQKYMSVMQPIELKGRIPIINILNITEDSDEENKEDKKIDLQILPQTQGSKQELLRYEELISLAHQTITKIKDAPIKEKNKSFN